MVDESRYEYTDADVSRVEAALKRMKTLEPPINQVRSTKTSIIDMFALQILELQKEGWSLPSICEKLKEMTEPPEGQPGKALDIGVGTLKTYLSKWRKENAKKPKARRAAVVKVGDYGEVERSEMERG